jgi:hypothetical protein
MPESQPRGSSGFYGRNVGEAIGASLGGVSRFEDARLRHQLAMTTRSY